MTNNIFSTLDISAKGMSLQRARLGAVANNIANVNTTKDTEGNVYKREVVIAKKVEDTRFENELNDQIDLSRTSNTHGKNISGANKFAGGMVFEVRKDEAEPRLVFDPSHPDARDDGYVEYPDINIVTEMVEMITAQRAFDANVQVTDAAKNIAKYSLEI